MLFENRRFVDTMYCTYIMSVASANTAEMATYPLDLTKTRLQIQGEKAVGSLEQIHQTEYRGTLRTAYGIVQEEGFLNLWRGITPAVYRHIVYSGLRIVTYEHLRHNVFKTNDDGSFPLWKAAVTGATAGAIGQFCASPADLVKVQLQMEGKRRLLGKPPRVLGAHHAFKKIWLEGGIRGLWKGWVPNVQRAALVNLGDLTAYDMTKQYILRNTNLQDNIITHSLASVCAGFVAALMSTPADVMKSRVMNQPTDEMGRGLLYKGSIDCVIKTVNNEGFFALYKGFIPVWLKLAPWAITFWVSYEQMRSFLGVGSF